MTILPLAIGIIGLAGLLATYIFYFVWKKKMKSNEVIGSKSSYWNFNTDRFMQQSYAKSIRVPILKKLVRNIRSKFETLAVYDEYRLRKEVMRVIFGLVVVVMVILLLLMLFRPSILVTFWIFVGILFSAGVLIDFFVHRVELKLLIQIKEFDSHVSAFFLETKNVEQSVFEATQLVGPEMKIQADHIYGILTSLAPEEELAKYDEVAPVRFLKMIVGVCLKVRNHGDVYHNNRSTFLAGLSSINKEINADIMFRQKLSQRLKGAAVSAIVPIFFALPLQYWAVTTFPIMKNFFDSRWGFLSIVLAYAISILAYTVIRKMGEIVEARYTARTRRFKWEEWAIKNVPFLEKVVNGFTPVTSSKKYFQLTRLLKESNSSLKIEWLTLRRMVFSVAVFLLVLGGIWYSTEREVKSVMSSDLPLSTFTGKNAKKDYQIYQETTSFDRKVIGDLKQVKNFSLETVETEIARQLGIQIDDKKVKDASSRILSKWEVVDNAYIKWWEVLITILLVVAVWYMPVWYLRFQRSMRMKDMENEVHQFIVIIIILRNFDRISVYTILEWMERFAVVFKEPLQATLQLYDAGPEEALDYLNDQVSFAGFNQIIKRLKLSIVRVEIQEAFEDMDMEKEFYMEQRDEANFISLQVKGKLALFFGMVPVVSLVFLYIIIPFAYMSMTETSDLFSQMRS